MGYLIEKFSYILKTTIEPYAFMTSEQARDQRLTRHGLKILNKFLGQMYEIILCVAQE